MTPALARHGRLPWPGPGELDGLQLALYRTITEGPRAGDASRSPYLDASGRLEGPFNAMLMSPPVGAALQGVGAALRYESVLPARARELAILEVAAYLESDFEWHAHQRLARQAGLSKEVLSSVLAGERPGGLSPEEAAVWAGVAALLRRGDLDDDEHEGIARAFGDRGAVELVVLVGYYHTLGLLLRALRVPLPANVQAAFGTLSENDRKDVS